MKPEIIKVVVFSAAAFEVEPLTKLVAGSTVEFEFIEIGVGSLAAARNSQMIGQKCVGRHSLFVGTCGVFGEFSEPELVTASSAKWLPACERTGISYAVPNTAPDISFLTPGILAHGLRAAKVICAPNISLVDTLPGSIRNDRCVENLELYSCAEALAKNSLSLSVLLCVTNAVGKDAHTQWKSNFAQAAQLTAGFIKENLWRLK